MIIAERNTSRRISRQAIPWQFSCEKAGRLFPTPQKTMVANTVDGAIPINCLSLQSLHSFRTSNFGISKDLKVDKTPRVQVVQRCLEPN